MAADFSLKAHDLLPIIQATLTQGGVAVNLTTATGVKFIMATAVGGTVKVNAAAAIVDAVNGVVSYTWVTGDTNTPNSYVAEWQVTWSGGKQETFPTLTYHSIDIVADLDNA